MNKTGNHNLKKQEINIYREIQRNTEMAMKALDAVTDKIYDDRLAAVVAEQELQYSRLHDSAESGGGQGPDLPGECHGEHDAALWNRL